jgi:hypothetical protein
MRKWPSVPSVLIGVGFPFFTGSDSSFFFSWFVCVLYSVTVVCWLFLELIFQANSPTVLYLTTFSFIFRRTLIACCIRTGVDVVADLSLVGSDLAVGVCWSVFGVAVSQQVWWFGADPEVLCGIGVVVVAVLPFSA